MTFYSHLKVAIIVQWPPILTWRLSLCYNDLLFSPGGCHYVTMTTYSHLEVAIIVQCTMTSYSHLEVVIFVQCTMTSYSHLEVAIMLQWPPILTYRLLLCYNDLLFSPGGCNVQWPPILTWRLSLGWDRWPDVSQLKGRKRASLSIFQPFFYKCAIYRKTTIIYQI